MNDFGWALNQLRNGYRVCRMCWPEDSWIYLDRPKNLIVMITPVRKGGYTFTQEDILATDWGLVY